MKKIKNVKKNVKKINLTKKQCISVVPRHCIRLTVYKHPYTLKEMENLESFDFKGKKWSHTSRYVAHNNRMLVL